MSAVYLDKDWTRKYFVDQADLFLIVMESKEMQTRGEWLSAAIANYLRDRGFANAKILELGCGTGRIAIPLAQQGFTVVGIDISRKYIEIATEKARRFGVESRTVFRVCDAREALDCVSDLAPFDVAMFVWATIIGYYDEETDVYILKQVRELVRDGGLLIIADTPSKDYISFLSNFVGGSKWFVDYGDYVVVEEPMYNPVNARLLVRQFFYRKEGRDLKFLGETHFSIRVYSLNELTAIASKAGWCLLEALKNFSSREPYRTLAALNVVYRAC